MSMQRSYCKSVSLGPNSYCPRTQKKEKAVHKGIADVTIKLKKSLATCSLPQPSPPFTRYLYCEKDLSYGLFDTHRDFLL